MKAQAQGTTTKKKGGKRRSDPVRRLTCANKRSEAWGKVKNGPGSAGLRLCGRRVVSCDFALGRSQ